MTGLNTLTISTMFFSAVNIISILIIILYINRKITLDTAMTREVAIVKREGEISSVLHVRWACDIPILGMTHDYPTSESHAIMRLQSFLHISM